MPLNPLNWTAGPFLTLYVALAAVAIIACVVLRKRIGGGRSRPAKLDALELAYLAGGPQRVSDALTVALLTAKAGKLSPDGRNIELLHGGVRLPPPVEPFAALLGSGTVTRLELQKRVKDGVERIKAKLQGLGLTPSAEQLSVYRWQTVALMLVPLLLGLNKMFVGFERGKPVGFLIALLVITFFTALTLLSAPLVTKAGKQALADHQAQNARAARAPRDHELMLAVALSGLVVLSGTAYAEMHKAAQADGTSGSGCGGGGGDGGGGGGGCGGCGG